MRCEWGAACRVCFAVVGGARVVRGWVRVFCERFFSERFFCERGVQNASASRRDTSRACKIASWSLARRLASGIPWTPFASARLHIPPVVLQTQALAISSASHSPHACAPHSRAAGVRPWPTRPARLDRPFAFGAPHGRDRLGRRRVRVRHHRSARRRHRLRAPPHPLQRQTRRGCTANARARRSCTTAPARRTRRRLRAPRAR